MKKLNILRLVLSMMYLFSSVFNFIITITQIELYRSWKDGVLIPIFKYIIEESTDIQFTLLLLGVSFSQFVIGTLLISKNEYVKLGLIGAMLFHIGIMPLGIWNLPNILFVIPLVILYNQEFKNNIYSALFSKQI